MPDYNYNRAPWYSQQEKINRVVIENGVTNIGVNAFYQCNNLNSITIPNSVTSIGHSAFEKCSGLTSIIIPNSVANIGDRVFSGCSGLISIMIPNSVTSIGHSLFYNCSSLASIAVENGNSIYDSRNNCNAIIKTESNALIVGCKNTFIPNSVMTIGDGAFYGCTWLTSITIPNSVTSIGGSAFYGCKWLTSITIPNSVVNIGYGAFYACSSLTSITIPSSVTSIGNSAFESCTSLTSINVEKGNKKYDSRKNCNAIIETKSNTLIKGCENTIIPNSVTSIETDAFLDCFGLTSITIPNSVTSIGVDAFFNCSGLTSVTIPNSVTSIGMQAFGYCSKLKSVTIPNSVTSIGDNVFYNCSSLTSIIIPNSVTSIGRSAFLGCSSLTSITIPNSVTSIGVYAFHNCFSLISIVCESNTSPDCYDLSFDNINKSIPVYVPANSIDAYKNADVWKDFTNIQAIPDTYILTDGTSYINNSLFNGCDISYTRTFNNTAWQGLYIPFSLSYDDWKDDFDVAYINGIRQIDTNDDNVIDETIMDVYRIEEGSLIPNTPYLIRAKTTGEKTISVSNATLYEAKENSIDCSTTISKYTFTGTYETIPASTLIENEYYAMGGGSVIMTDGESDLKPYRWYLKVEDSSPIYNAAKTSNAAKTITINVIDEEGEATEISQVSQNDKLTSQIYDLNGRVVNENALKPGIYIKNGKKFVIK